MNKMYIFIEANQCVLRERMHWFVRNFLARYYKVRFQDITIVKGKFGKPYAFVNKEKADLYFNISHTLGVGIVAFSKDEIGIDIEEIREPDFRIMKRFYHDSELKYVMRQEDVQNQVEKFYEVWTKKEAFLKYTGLGLAGRLSKLDVLEQKYIYRKYEWYGKLYAIAVYSEHLGEFSWKFVNSIRD